ncbi:MAG: DUF5317 family protein [Coriobacteriia bacterium]
MILFEALVLALLLSLVTGGSLRNLEQERLRGEWLLMVLLPLQIAWPRLSEMGGLGRLVSLVIWLIMMGSLAVVLVANTGKQRMLGVAAVGIVLNMLVIGLNGAMPVSLRSVSEIGASRADAVAKMEADRLHEVLDAGTRLTVLSDVIAVPGPEWHRGVVSVGDLLLAAGLSTWVFGAIRRQERRMP